MKEKLLLLSKKLSNFQIKLLLTLLYILIISPMGLIWRLIGKDPLNKKLSPGQDSYFINYHENELDLVDFSKPF